MTWSEIALLVLSISVTAIPVVGNVAIMIAKRRGWKDAEDFLTRWVPIAVAATKSKTREEAIAIVVDEILSPYTLPASERATTAAKILLPTVDTTKASKLPSTPPS